MRSVLIFAAGAAVMFLILKILASNKVTGTSASTDKLKRLLITQEFANLVRTNEARELVKTQAFRDFAKTLAAEQVVALSVSLVS